MRRHREELRPIADINVTNLLDTAFVLLMAFMIVAPAIKSGIKIDLPQVKAGALETDEKKTVTVVLEKRAMEGSPDRIYIDEKRFAPEELRAEVDRQLRLFPEMDVVVQGDRDVRLETLLQVVGVLQEAGVENIGFPVQPLPPKEERNKPNP